MSEKKAKKPKLSKKVREARERWAALNVFGLRIFEAKGAVTACINHANRHDLTLGKLEDILRQLTEEAGSVANHRAAMATLCDYETKEPE